MKVKHYDNNFHIKCETWENTRVKKAPNAKIDKATGLWTLAETVANAHWLEREAGQHEITELVKSKILTVKSRATSNTPFPTWYKFKTDPMPHQLSALNAAWKKEQIGLFMEMGTGKTWVDIQLACAYRMEGDIDALVVICPTAIKPVWEIELDKHAPIPVQTHILEAGKYKAFERWAKQKHDFPVLIVGIEGLSQGNADQYVLNFVKGRRCMLSIDESSSIKNFKSQRTEKCWDIGAAAVIRTVMTGTPITQGIEDLFAQFFFLNWEIIGQKSFYAFRNRYCEMGGFENKKITGYQNIGELLEITSKHVYICTKKEALDLPDKVFAERYIEPSPAQKKAIRELKEDHETKIGLQLLECETMLERMTRFQQICGGNYPYKIDEDNPDSKWATEPLPGKNPKMDELFQVLDDLPKGVKVIIWARFIPEIELILKNLEEKRPGTTLHYYGGTEKSKRRATLDSFQEDPQFTQMVSNQQIGGMGVTWTAATYVIYYSNTFSYQDRIQSEDRAHRKGQTNKVTYIDLILNVDQDKMIKTALARKQSMADYVTENMQLAQLALTGI